MNNGLFISPYSHGTSFLDIIESIKVSAKKHSWDIVSIGGKESSTPSKIKDNFLDAEGDVLAYYRDFGTLLSNSDKFKSILFIDFFSPGIDILQYLLEIKGKNIKLGALLHGGSFLPRDLYVWPRLKYSENLRFSIFDIIYVPSKHLYNLVPDVFKGKVKILPWGMDSFLSKKPLSEEEKNIDILFPHRLDDDKGIDDLIFLISKLRNYTFVITSFRSLENNKYYKRLKIYKNVRFVFGENEEQHLHTLSKAKIVLSCAYQENFGYGIVKSVLSGAIPILPDREVYSELFPGDFLYSTLDGAAKKITTILENKDEYSLLSKKIKKTCMTLLGFSFSKILKDFYKFKG
ncbi:MAG: glycosyltransferase [Candidatus Absconditabacterales bacterium]